MIEKPYWQIQHDWWIDDFEYQKNQREEILLLLRAHPNDKLSGNFKNIVKIIDNHIKELRKEYKKIYGTYPKNRK